MSLKIACIHCGFVFEDEDMEVCPICGTELGQEWNPADLQSFVVTELTKEQAEVVAKLVHKSAAEVSKELAADGCYGINDLTPVQVDVWGNQLKAAGIEFVVENAEQKALRIQKIYESKTAAENAKAAEIKARAETQKAADMAKVAEAERIKAEAIAKAKADVALAAKAAADKAEAEKVTAEAVRAKAEAEAESMKAAKAAEIAADEKAKAEAEARAQADAAAVAKAAADKAEAEKQAAESAKAKAQLEAEAVKAAKAAEIAADEKAKAEAEARAQADAAAVAKAAADKAEAEKQAAESAKAKAQLEAEAVKAAKAAEIAADEKAKAEAEARAQADAAAVAKAAADKAEAEKVAAEAKARQAKAESSEKIASEKTRQMELEASENLKKRRHRIILLGGCGAIFVVLAIVWGVSEVAHNSNVSAKEKERIQLEEMKASAVRLVEETAKIREAERLAAEKKINEERLAAKAKADAALAAETAKIREAERLAAEKKINEERLAAKAKADAALAAETAKIREAERLAAEKKINEERLAAKAKADAALAAETAKIREEERLAAEKKINEERLAAKAKADAALAAETAKIREEERVAIAKEEEQKRIAAEKKMEEMRKALAHLKNMEIKQSVYSLQDNVTLEMMLCPAGSFTMGSPKDEYGRPQASYDNEYLHRVTLTKPFLIGKYEVTQSQYEAVMGDNPSYFKGANHPVDHVSWNNAMAFCNKLNTLTEGKRPEGYHFTLPTEAQWEYACRAGTTTAFNNGKNLHWLSNSAMDEVGWYDKNSGRQTHPVGQKKPNAWGIYDMHGNVPEWCIDLDNGKEDVIDPIGELEATWRGVRGGGYGESAERCRSAHRGDVVPRANDNLFGGLGFRVVLVPVQ